jgi:Fic family protein
MLLLKKGYAYVPYSSMESIIEAGKEGYYRALRRTQKGIWSDKVDYEPWLSFFLTSLQKQKKHLEDKIKIASADDTKLGRTARAILALFDDKAEWSIPEIVKELDMNVNTAGKTVKSLIDNGYLAKHGSTRGAWYEKTEE